MDREGLGKHVLLVLPQLGRDLRWFEQELLLVPPAHPLRGDFQLLFQWHEINIKLIWEGNKTSGY